MKVCNGINVIRGIVVDFKEVVKYWLSIIDCEQINEVIIECIDEVLKYNSKIFSYHIDPNLSQLEAILQLCNHSSIGNMLREHIYLKFNMYEKVPFVHTWNCCSPLAHKKYILGYNVDYHYSSQQIVTIDQPSTKYDIEIQTKLKTIELNQPLQSICILNGCPSLI